MRFEAMFPRQVPLATSTMLPRQRSVNIASARRCAARQPGAATPGCPTILSRPRRSLRSSPPLSARPRLSPLVPASLRSCRPLSAHPREGGGPGVRGTGRRHEGDKCLPPPLTPAKAGAQACEGPGGDTRATNAYPLRSPPRRRGPRRARDRAPTRRRQMPTPSAHPRGREDPGAPGTGGDTRATNAYPPPLTPAEGRPRRARDRRRHEGDKCLPPFRSPPRRRGPRRARATPSPLRLPTIPC